MSPTLAKLIEVEKKQDASFQLINARLSAQGNAIARLTLLVEILDGRMGHIATALRDHGFFGPEAETKQSSNGAHAETPPM